MRYVIFVIDSESGSAQSGEMAAIDAFNAELETNGQFVLAAGISNAKAKVIDNRADLDQVRDGSLFNGPEFYSGFWLIQANSDEQALELAKAGSKACNRRVELRPYLGQ